MKPNHDAEGIGQPLASWNIYKQGQKKPKSGDGLNILKND
jgi:hypothetical protein